MGKQPGLIIFIGFFSSEDDKMKTGIILDSVG
jgi:hypothetical protein